MTTVTSHRKLSQSNIKALPYHIAYHTLLELFEELPKGPKGQMLSLQVYIHSVIEYAAVVWSPYSYMHMYCHIRLVEVV